MAIVPYTSSHMAAKRIRENQHKEAKYDSDISFVNHKVSKSDKYCDIILLTVLVLLILFMFLLAIDAIFKIGIILSK